MRRAILAIVSTVAALVLLLSFKSHTTSAVTKQPAAIPSTGAGTPASGPGAASGSGTISKPRSGSSATSARTVTGAASQTIYGPVQVKVTVRAGKLAAVDAVQYPQNTPRDAQINSYAIPALSREALAAGSAHIDTISGATYTSGGYVTSLQSALNKAGL